MQTRPIHPVNQRGELRCSQSHYPIADRRPSERTLLQPLPEQHQAGAVPGQDFQTVRSLRAENEDHSRERIMLELLANHSRETVGASAEVHRLGRHQNLHACRSRNHVAAFTARNTSRSQAKSPPGATRTTALPISIVIAGQPWADAPDIIPSWRSSVTTGTNSGVSSAGKLSKPLRAALRQANRCCAEMSCRRATSDTTAPGAYDSATIRPLASPLQRRRRPAPTWTSTRPRGREVSTIWSTIYATPHPKVGRIVPRSTPITRWEPRTAYRRTASVKLGF